MVSSKGTEISHLTQCKNANKKLFSEAVQKCFNGQTFYFAFSSTRMRGHSVITLGQYLLQRLGG